MTKAFVILNAADRGSRKEMVLQTALGPSLMFRQGVSGRARSHDKGQRLPSAFRTPIINCQPPLAWQHFAALLGDAERDYSFSPSCGDRPSSTDVVTLSTADSIHSCSLFFLGEYSTAMTYARRAVDRIAFGTRPFPIACSGMDHSIQGRRVVAQALWNHGLLDQSALATEDVVTP